MPTISSFEPSDGIIGNNVTITGTNFSTFNSIVKFNGVMAEVSSGTETSLTVKVPTGATTGSFTVSTPGGTATSNQDFKVFKYTVTTIAGLVGVSGHIEGTGSSSRFNYPYAIILESSSLYVTGNSIRTIINAMSSSNVGDVSTAAGSTSGVNGSTDANNNAARFFAAQGITIDSSGNFFIADTFNYTIRKMTGVARVVTTFAGTAGSSGSTDGTGNAARFNDPHGIVADSIGNLYVTSNHAIRKITSGGVVTTFAGTSGSSGSTDGTGNSASFSFPKGIVADSIGNLYVADSGNSAIRKITSGGVVTTFVGTSGKSGSTDGTGNAARFNSPAGIAMDSSGNFYVADSSNHAIRKITKGGVVSTIAGGKLGSVDGNNTSAAFKNPVGITVASDGTIFVTDTDNHTIRKIVP